jgi:hypothetical protein
MPPAARPLTNVRLEVLECMPFMSNQSKGKPCETTSELLIQVEGTLSGFVLSRMSFARRH